MAVLRQAATFGSTPVEAAGLEPGGIHDPG
jgi:hypothetical protein